MAATGLAASWTYAQTTLFTNPVLTPVTGAAVRVGGFMQVPLVLRHGTMQVRPKPAQHAVAPKVVQPLAPTVLQAVAGERGT